MNKISRLTPSRDRILKLSTIYFVVYSFSTIVFTAVATLLSVIGISMPTSFIIALLISCFIIILLYVYQFNKIYLRRYKYVNLTNYPQNPSYNLSLRENHVLYDPRIIYDLPVYNAPISQLSTIVETLQMSDMERRAMRNVLLTGGRFELEVGIKSPDGYVFYKRLTIESNGKVGSILSFPLPKT